MADTEALEPLPHEVPIKDVNENNATGYVLHPHEHIINDYFTSFNAKSTPIYMCNGPGSQIVYRLPKRLQCQLTPVNTPSHIRNLTIWQEAYTIATIPAISCEAVTTFIRKSWFFFGSYSSEITTEARRVEPSECKEMADRLVSPEGDLLVRTDVNTYATKNIDTVQYSWPNTAKDNFTNYVVSTVTVTVNNQDSSVLASIPLTEKCHYTARSCQGNQGSVLIWNSDLIPRCRLQQVLVHTNGINGNMP